jgi:glycosyltransferase involved in cell wall biosynthesis
LIITNLWPTSQKPAYGPFVKRSVDGLEALGIKGDVLFVHGYMGKSAYVCAAIIVTLLSAEKRYRLVHAHGGETALIARFYASAPVIASYLGSDLLAPTENGWPVRIRSTILRRHAALMTATTTKSRHMESVLPRAARRRNRIIPDGVELRKFTPIDRDVARMHLNWSRAASVVLFAGRADPIKRLWLAREAVELARRELPDLELAVVSTAAPGEMPLYYSAADCLLHTSSSEGSPNVIKEALACNLPIVATPAGDIEELVKRAHPGAVVPAEARALAIELVRCCRVPTRSNGRTLTNGLDLESAAIATLDFYRSVKRDFATRQRGTVGGPHVARPEVGPRL